MFNLAAGVDFFVSRSASAAPLSSELESSELDWSELEWSDELWDCEASELDELLCSLEEADSAELFFPASLGEDANFRAASAALILSAG